MLSKLNNFSIENISKITTNNYIFTDSYDYGIKNLDASITETKALFKYNKNFYPDIPTFSKDNKNEPLNENNGANTFFLNNILENNELYNDNDELCTEKNQRNELQKSIFQDNVENVFNFKLNINEEQFQKDYLDEKGESEKPRKIRSKHDYLIKSFL